MKYPKDAVDVKESDYWIACPHCNFEMEMHESNEEPYGKDTEFVPPHYCYPLSEEVDTMWLLEDDFWIKY